MHGSWSIWLISTVFGFLVAKNFDVLLALAVVLFLFSVEPSYDLISSGRISRDFAIPIAFLLTLAILFLKNPNILPFVIAYSLMLAAQIALKNNVGAFTGLGSVVMTFPFPLVASYLSVDLYEILRALIFLILLVTYSFTLVLYRNRDLKKPALITLTILTIFTFSPTAVYIFFLTISVLMFLAVKRISLKGVGKSLLAYQFTSIFTYQFLFL